MPASNGSRMRLCPALYALTPGGGLQARLRDGSSSQCTGPCWFPALDLEVVVLTVMCPDVEIDVRGRVHVSAKVAEDLIALGLRVWLSLMPLESTNALRSKFA
jgi:hypothetical protein